MWGSRYGITGTRAISRLLGRDTLAECYRCTQINEHIDRAVKALEQMADDLEADPGNVGPNSIRLVAGYLRDVTGDLRFRDLRVKVVAIQ